MTKLSIIQGAVALWLSSRSGIKLTCQRCLSDFDRQAGRRQSHTTAHSLEMPPLISCASHQTARLSTETLGQHSTLPQIWPCQRARQPECLPTKPGRRRENHYLPRKKERKIKNTFPPPSPHPPSTPLCMSFKIRVKGRSTLSFGYTKYASGPLAALFGSEVSDEGRTM